MKNETQEFHDDDVDSRPPMIDVTKASRTPSTAPSLRLPVPTTTVPVSPPVVPVINKISCPCFDISDINILIEDILPMDTNELDKAKSCIDKPGSEYGLYYTRCTEAGFTIDYKGFGVDNRKDHKTCSTKGRASGMVLQVTKQEGEACHSLMKQACASIR